NKPSRHLSSDWHLYCAGSQGRAPLRPAGRAANQVRIRNQSEHRKDAGPRSAAHIVGPRRRGDRMKRRDFVTLLGAATAARPLAARAQRTTMPIVGFLNSASADKYAHLAAAFRQGLNDLGFVDGQNIKIEYRWAAGQYDRLSEMAAGLVRREPAVIAANTPAVMPAKKATSTIPIVFFTAADPVEAGFVASLNRPGGNLTGISG